MVSLDSAFECKIAVEYELTNILDKHGEFNSYHEFYGVLKEEFEETMENNAKFYAKINELWLAIRKDNINCIKSNTDDLYQIAFNNLCEWVQVCAVIQKYKRGDVSDKD